MSESLFTSQTPNTTDNSDGGAAGIEVGTGLVFAVAGFVTDGRFWATDTTSGTWTWELFRADQGDNVGAGHTLLVSKVATGVVPGWNTVHLDTPIAVTTATVYRSAVNNSQGRYVHRPSVFAAGAIVNGNITGYQDGTDPAGIGTMRNGSFALNSPAGSYPSDNAAAAAFYTDVVFTTSIGETVDLTPAALTLSAVALDPVSGAVELDLTPAALSLVGVAVSPVPGPVTIALTPASLALASVALDPVPEPVSVALSPVSMALQTVPVTGNLTPGSWTASQSGPSWTAGGGATAWSAA